MRHARMRDKKAAWLTRGGVDNTKRNRRKRKRAAACPNRLRKRRDEPSLGAKEARDLAGWCEAVLPMGLCRK